MRPISELCSGEHAQLFLQGATLSHLDATLKQREEAQRLLAGHLAAELGARGVEAIDSRVCPGADQPDMPYRCPMRHDG